ncbi:MAG TPA: DUF4139 domain-containing protein [Polyangiaceae bacterium]|nr:DUF4139 domain-containing protein [Polyangiaceae bacterium]
MRHSFASVRRCAIFGLTVGVGLASLGCARKPAVSADGLPLRRVVIYRNGVGYFERAGHIEADKVNFKVKGSEVGDFLATLAVIEKGGSSVRSASFPLKVEGQDAGEPEAPLPAEDDDAPVRRRRPTPPAPKKADLNKLETVVLELDGKEHDLQVGYVAETPVWRPSYRLVIEKDGSNLQAWGIVQNLSGEDWKGVSLSLIAGAPLAFEATLGTPIIPARPTVTDMGEVIASVPRSETSLNQEPMAEPAPPPPSPAEAPGSMADLELSDSAPSRDDKKDSASRSSRPSKTAPAPKAGRAAGAMAAGGMPKPAPAMRPMTAAAPAAPTVQRANPSVPRNLSALAAVAMEGGSTRYDIPNAITVPDKNATMVMLLSKHVPGEAIFLFAPDYGVPDSQSHPFRVARFTNKSGGLLERGPIAIFEQGAFLGQGMVDPLPDGATTTVPFALERSLAVETQRDSTEEGARVAKIESGDLTIERDSVSRTRYRVKNGGDKAAKLLVKHPRNTQARLHNPPKGTDDNVGTHSALVPVDSAPHAISDLVVDERRSTERLVDWLSQQADDAVRLYMADRRSDAAAVASLRSAWEVRVNLVRAAFERTKLTSEQGELQKATEETRRNLKALEKNRTAADLRDQLTQRLAKNSLRLEEITKRLVEVDMRVNEQRVRFTDTVRSVKVLSPPKAE